jgi:N-acetylglutamate synthase
MILRPITINDFSKLIIFWQENYKVNVMDDYEHLKLYFEKNPELSTLAEENGETVGTCLESFDGRKGYISKVAVKFDCRKKGLGKKLVLETIKKIKGAGALDIRVACDGKLVPFYEKCGFKLNKIPHLKIKL